MPKIAIATTDLTPVDTLCRYVGHHLNSGIDFGKVKPLYYFY
jgi:hypothetical protein